MLEHAQAAKCQGAVGSLGIFWSHQNSFFGIVLDCLTSNMLRMPKACVGFFQESSGPEHFFYYLCVDLLEIDGYLQVARCEVASLIRSVLIWSGPDVGTAIGGRSSGLFGDILGPRGPGQFRSWDSDARIEGKIGEKHLLSCESRNVQVSLQWWRY